TEAVEQATTMHAANVDNTHGSGKFLPFPRSAPDSLVAGRMYPFLLRAEVLSIRIFGCKRHKRTDGARQKLVIHADKTYPFAAGLLQGFVPRIVDAFIGFTFPVRNCTAITSKYFYRAVG